MTTLSIAPSLNDNHDEASGTSQTTRPTVASRLPSEPVLRVMRTALQCLGPLAPSDAMVLSRMLNRLFEIEDDDGISVAISHAHELAEVLQMQQPAAR